MYHINSVSFIHIIEFLGAIVFVISGIRLASTRQMDWFGAFFVGFVTAVGGGTVRDLMLDLPPFWMQNSIYIICAIIAMVIVVVFRKMLVRLQYTFFTFDTIGLALFTVVGIEKTLQCGFPYWVAAVMGLITGAVGGIIRDILINEIPLVFRKEIYALACLFGGFFYWVSDAMAFPKEVSQLGTAVVVIVTRVVAVKYQIGLPILKGEEDDVEN